MDANKLDYVVIGAQKCATSWLYYCLRDHPQICVPSKKLEAGYIGGSMYAEKGEDWFFDRFTPDPGQITGDVSVEYLWDPQACAALMPFAKGSKLVISLRNPVDRTVSGYFWLLRKGNLPNKPLEQGIAPILDASPGFPDAIEGPLDEAVRRSFYGPQIQRFIDAYGAENIKVVLYEDIAQDGLSVAQDIFAFLGADPSFVPPSITSAPKKNSYNRWLLALENSTRSKMVARFCNYAHQALTYFSTRRDILPKSMRARLNILFKPVVADTISVLDQLPQAQRPSDAALAAHWKVE